MKYQKPCMYSFEAQIPVCLEAQYVINITDQSCHGDICGGQSRVYQGTSGREFNVDSCSFMPIGEVMYIKCAETGGQIYTETFVSSTPGGSASCPPGSTPVVLKVNFQPSLPPACTVISELYGGVDRCLQTCGGSNPICGDGSCNGDENCNVCADDCGSCSGSCIDQVKNGSETDVDCGGLCTACATGKQCAVDSDCTSNVCTSLVCQAPNCSDLTKNGNETDVDCGGSCSPCGYGKECLVDSDCYNGYCSGGYCAPY